MCTAPFTWLQGVFQLNNFKMKGNYKANNKKQEIKAATETKIVTDEKQERKTL